MKVSPIKIAVFIFLLAFISLQNLFAQAEEDNETESKSHFGLGVSLFNLSDYTYDIDFAPSNSIYFVIELGDKLRLEPSFGMVLTENLKQYSLGMGLFGKKPISKFNILYGFRFGIRINQSTAFVNSGGFFGGGSTKTVFNNVMIFAPTIGGEYYFIKNFSIGSEVQIRGIKSENEWITHTNSSVLLRFYF